MMQDIHARELEQVNARAEAAEDAAALRDAEATRKAGGACAVLGGLARAMNLLLVLLVLLITLLVYMRRHSGGP